MRDPFGRTVRSLRISVTQKCNLNCFYCHNEGQANSHCEMTRDEFGSIVKVAADLGIRKLKLTGGEPLMREDIVEIIGKIAGHVDEVSMTTNGVLLERCVSRLQKKGLKRVNISLDSLDPRTFRMITGVERLDDALEGIDSALEFGLGVKLNTVMLRDINTMELRNLLDFAADKGAILQLIELATGRCNLDSDLYTRYHYDLSNIERYFHKKASKILLNELHNRKKYLIPLNGGSNTERVCEVELVRPMHNSEFCANCSRLRLTSDGKLKPCLLSSDGVVDILDAVRNNGGIDKLKAKFLEAVDNRRPYWNEDETNENQAEILCTL